MTFGPMRDRVLRGLARTRARPHRYTIVRWVVGVLATVAIALLPALGILRFDLWRGRHVYLGEPLGFADAARRFVFPFLAINIAIVLASRFVGRYLCGFVCPYGAITRLFEWTSSRRLVFAASTVLAAITFSFWVDWRVFVDGSALAIALSAAFLGGTIAVLYATVSSLGLRFCRDYCPSGVYFAVLGHDTNCGIAHAHPENCTDCGACERVCPVDLDPRKIASTEPRVGQGLYPDGLSNHAVCIRCGDCVATCERVTTRSDATPLELGWLRASEPQKERCDADTA